MHTGIWRKDAREGLATSLYRNEDGRRPDVEGKEAPPGVLFVLDSRTLQRDCLIECLGKQGVKLEIVPCGTVRDVRMRKLESGRPSAILVCIGDRIVDEISSIIEEFDPVPIMLLAESEEPIEVLNALECGVKGYIPQSTSISICVEAINLAMAGGVYVPASCVLTMAKVAATEAQSTPMADMFTRRQLQVIEALRRGKANKIIAYELNLQESTVKVHIRQIMKKLKATNRTEVAYKLKELFPS